MRTTAIMVALAAIAGCQPYPEDDRVAPELEIRRVVASDARTRVVLSVTDDDGDMLDGQWWSSMCGSEITKHITEDRCAYYWDLDLTWWIDQDGWPSTDDCLDAHGGEPGWPILFTVCDDGDRCAELAVTWGISVG